MGIIPDRYNPIKQAQGAVDYYNIKRERKEPLFNDPLKGILRDTRFDVGAQTSQVLENVFGSRTPYKGAFAGTQLPADSALAQTGDLGRDGLSEQDLLNQDIGNIVGGLPVGEGDGLYGGEGRSAEQIRQAELQRQAYIDQANKWADDLIAQAKGDMDFAVRELDAQHQSALGNNDADRAKFFEQVADALEEKIGTIPYDFERGITRLGENKQRALERLSRDETELRRQFGVESEQARRQQGETLSQRGLLTGTREKTVGLGARDVRELESEVAARLGTLERGFTEGREDIGRTFTRGTEDVTKEARRAGLQTQRTFEFGKEEQQRAFEAARKRLEREREQEIDLARAFQFTGIK